MMVTGSHGVRMQCDYTGDAAGLPGAVSAASPRWLRLTRPGDTVTGYDSADGTHWIRGRAPYPGRLPPTVLAGLFVASPDYAVVTSRSVGSSGTGGPPWPPRPSTASRVRARGPPARGRARPSAEPRRDPYPALGSRQSGGAFAVTGSGDIARRAVPRASGSARRHSPGRRVRRADRRWSSWRPMFITAEYRRGLIRVTLAASPRRGRVLAAKAIVVGSVAFVAGAARPPWPPRCSASRCCAPTATSSVPVPRAHRGARAGRHRGAAGRRGRPGPGPRRVLRRSAGPVTAVIAVIVAAVLLRRPAGSPARGAADWLLRVTPAAGFAIQQPSRLPAGHQRLHPGYGYYPLAPWAGFAVLCAWTALALGWPMPAARGGTHERRPAGRAARGVDESCVPWPVPAGCCWRPSC